MLDPDFPERLLQSGYQRTMEFIHFLSQDYSKRGLTEKTDRCVAISGLGARIARALDCKSRYGIFERYLHSNLLWQASDNKMEEIAYETQHVPSWSWMAYSGGIQFMDIPFGKVDWIDDLRFDEECDCDHAIIADVGVFQDCLMRPHGKRCAVLDSGGKERGWIQYDAEDGGELCKEQCVVVGRTEKSCVEEYYILVIRPTRVDSKYRRVGVGMIHSDYVVRRGINVRVV